MNKKEYDKIYREKHKKRRSIQCKAWREANKEKLIKYRKDFYQANKERMNEQARSWYNANIERGRELSRKKARAYMIRNPWANHYQLAKARCTNSNLPTYKYYGGKGVKLLMEKADFRKLWFRDKAYLMKQPSIDRKNSNGNYEYTNCRFIELVENIARTIKILTGKMFICETCLKKFYRPPSEIKEGKTKHCSIKCRWGGSK